jgi:hypothetical protein
MSLHPDIVPIQAALSSIAEDATALDWAKERPWTPHTHVWDEAGVVAVDLHDLNAALAKRVLAAVAELGATLECGGVIFVTGQGRHSVGLPVLRSITIGTLVRFEAERGWRQRDLGAGRVLLVVDEDRVPARYRRTSPVWVSVFLLAFCGMLVWTLPPQVGLPLLIVAAWFGFGVWRAGRRR